MIELRRFVVIGPKSAAWKDCDSSGLFIWDRILFTTIFDCFVYRGTYHIPVCLLLVPFNICCTFDFTVNVWYSVMMHPSSNKTHNNISGAVIIFGRT